MPFAVCRIPPLRFVKLLFLGPTKIPRARVESYAQFACLWSAKRAFSTLHTGLGIVGVFNSQLCSHLHIHSLCVLLCWCLWQHSTQQLCCCCDVHSLCGVSVVLHGFKLCAVFQHCIGACCLRVNSLEIAMIRPHSLDRHCRTEWLHNCIQFAVTSHNSVVEKCDSNSCT